MFDLGQICQILKQNLEASLLSSDLALFAEKARCFSQSERALYENFIIHVNEYGINHLYYTIHQWKVNDKTS